MPRPNLLTCWVIPKIQCLVGQGHTDHLISSQKDILDIINVTNESIGNKIAIIKEYVYNWNSRRGEWFSDIC